MPRGRLSPGRLSPTRSHKVAARSVTSSSSRSTPFTPRSYLSSNDYNLDSLYEVEDNREEYEIEAERFSIMDPTDTSRFPNARGIKPETDETQGLTELEAQKFQDEFGFNELAKDEQSLIIQFLLKFWGPMPIMIWIAVGLEAGLRDWPSFGVLLAMQLVNGTLAFYEEQKAGSALAELEKELALNAHVIRDGTWITIPARELVEGDVVSVKLGDIIPADGLCFPGSGLPLIVDQAAINGTSSISFQSNFTYDIIILCLHDSQPCSQNSKIL